MSTNCLRCATRRRTGSDLLCDPCRAAASEPRSHWEVYCRWGWIPVLPATAAAIVCQAHNLRRAQKVRLA